MEGFSRVRFRQYAQDLEQAILKMAAMTDLRDRLKHLPNSQTMTMHYGQGGKTEIYTMGDIVKEFPAGVDHSEVAAAFETPATPIPDSPFADPKKKLIQ